MQVREVIVRDQYVTSLVIPIYVNDVPTFAVVDTAAQVTVVSSKIIPKDRSNNSQIEGENVWLKGVCRNSIMGQKVKDFPIRIGDQEYLVDVYVADIDDPVLLGLDFLCKHRCRVDLKTNDVTVEGMVVKAKLKRLEQGEEMMINRVLVKEKTYVPACSKAVIELKTEYKVEPSTTVVFEPTYNDEHVLLSSSLHTGSNQLATYLVNLREKGVLLPEGKEIGTITDVEIVVPDTQEPLDIRKITLEHGLPTKHIATESNPLGDKDFTADTVINLGTSKSEPNDDSQEENGEAEKSFLNSHGQDQPDKETVIRGSEEETQRRFSSHERANTLGKVENFLQVNEISLDRKEQPGKGNQISMPKHLVDLFNRSKRELQHPEAIQLGRLLIAYQDIFATHDLDIGCLKGIEHHINTGDATPVKHKLRRTPYGFEGEEEAYLKKLLEADVIRPSESEWASAPVFVRKRDGNVRYCLDFRDLNAKTLKDSFPLPNINDCLTTLSGSWFFSTLDLTSGYYQVELAEEDKRKTAFITKYGLFEHNRLPMGLCNSPATFQRAIQLVLRGLTWKEVLAYLDDVNVLGKDFMDHLNNLQQVFERFRQYNLQLKPKKCSLFQSAC